MYCHQLPPEIPCQILPAGCSLPDRARPAHHARLDRFLSAPAERLAFPVVQTGAASRQDVGRYGFIRKIHSLSRFADGDAVPGSVLLVELKPNAHDQHHAHLQVRDAGQVRKDVELAVSPILNFPTPVFCIAICWSCVLKKAVHSCCTATLRPMDVQQGWLCCAQPASPELSRPSSVSAATHFVTSSSQLMLISSLSMEGRIQRELLQCSQQSACLREEAKAM